jgi:ABC-type sugar transport system ATPase subunit
MVEIAIENLTKNYGSVAVLRDINLTIGKGEFAVLVGPSGCGKSTLLRCIAGLNTINGGAIRFDGKRVDALPPQERNLSMVFQNYALYPHLTVRDNLAFGLRVKGIAADEIERRVRWAAGLLSIEPYLERRPRALSGGQRQRVAMGRAMIKQSNAFLFDEPLSNLDAKLRVQMRKEISNLQRTVNVTSVYVTHDQVEAMTMGDKIVVMNAGRIEQIGRPMELYADPQTLFVAGFIGSPPMNLMPARSSGNSPELADGTVLASSVSHDGPVTIGFRPEHLLESADGPNAFTLPVKTRQELGSSVSYFAELAGSEIEVTDPRPAAALQQEIRISIPPQKLLVFARDGGRVR